MANFRLLRSKRITSLRILAFPCNQFLCEEPGTLEEIQHFFKETGARFDLFDKIDVNGEKAHHLFRYLKKCLPNKRTKLGVIKDNFTVFLVSRTGEPVARLEPPVYQDDLFEQLKTFFEDPKPSEVEEKGRKENTQ